MCVRSSSATLIFDQCGIADGALQITGRSAPSPCQCIKFGARNGLAMIDGVQTGGRYTGQLGKPRDWGRFLDHPGSEPLVTGCHHICNRM